MPSRNFGKAYKKGLLKMSKLYERIDHLCSERHINITTMCKESGASRGSLTDLKVGRKQSLSVETLRKIADYFNVSTDYLLGKEKTPAETGKRFPKKDSDLVFLSTEEQRRLYRYFSEAAERKGESIDLAVTQSGIPHNLMTRMRNESVSMCDRNDLIRLSEYLEVQTDAKPMLESLPPLDARRAELYRHLHDLVDQVPLKDADTAESLLRVFLDKQ